jgi:hypothetical protein
MARQEGGQCSIVLVRARVAWLAGAVAVAGAAAHRIMRRRKAAETDPRADELRQKLDESRPIVDENEREEFESAETTIDEADVGIEGRRQAVHERGRAAADEMRGRSST